MIMMMIMKWILKRIILILKLEIRKIIRNNSRIRKHNRNRQVREVTR